MGSPPCHGWRWDNVAHCDDVFPKDAGPMSNAKQAAFENLHGLSVLLKDMSAIGPELAQIASLEGATAEAQAKLDATRAAILKERADHDRAISNELARHRADIAKVKNDSEADA